jgi:hypothetical protein
MKKRVQTCEKKKSLLKENNNKYDPAKTEMDLA